MAQQIQCQEISMLPPHGTPIVAYMTLPDDGVAMGSVTAYCSCDVTIKHLQSYAIFVHWPIATYQAVTC